MSTQVSFSEKHQVKVETYQLQLRLALKDGSMRASPLIVDLSAFLLGEDGKIAEERDFVYYNGITSLQDGKALPSSIDGGVVGFLGECGMDRLDISLDKIRPSVRSITFLVSIYHEEGEAIPLFRSIEGLCLEVSDGLSKDVLYRVFLSGDFADQNTIQCGELSRKEAGWQWIPRQRLFSGGLEEATRIYADAFC